MDECEKLMERLAVSNEKILSSATLSTWTAAAGNINILFSISQR
jgi:hypothetical protein